MIVWNFANTLQNDRIDFIGNNIKYVPATANIKGSILCNSNFMSLKFLSHYHRSHVAHHRLELLKLYSATASRRTEQALGRKARFKGRSHVYMPQTALT